MQATITYLLTEQAQRAQMMATGQPVARKQIVSEDVPVELLTSPLCRVDEVGNVGFDLTQTTGISESGEVARSGGWATVYPGFDAIPESGVAALRTRNEQIAAKCVQVAADYAKRQVHRLAEETQRKAATDRHEAEVAAKAAAEAEREKLTTDYIAQWIAGHADEATRQQFIDGLLCRKTAVWLIADAAFAAAGVLEKASEIKVCDDRECPCGSTTVDCLPRSKYPSWQKIKAGLPNGYTVEFSRRRNCLRETEKFQRGSYGDEGEAVGPVEFVAEISIPHGPFTFERTVQLG